MVRLCEYGCGQEGKFYFPTVDKWCCSKHYTQCPAKRKETSIQTKKHWEDSDSGFNSISCREKRSTIMKEIRKDPNSKYNSDLYKEKISDIMKEKWEDPNSIFNSILCKEKMSNSSKLTIEKIKEKYKFFSEIEDLRYNPDKPEEIQVRCTNHNCPNSKEKDGWFTPTGGQFYQRKNMLTNEGEDKSNFYCSQECKDTCPSYYSHGADPYRNTKKPYTQEEYNIFNKEVLKRQRIRDRYNFCEMCYSIKNLHVHHEKPVKTHPHLALDPDNGIVLCKRCHYKIGHKTGTECSTGNLANKVQQGCTLGGQ